MAQAIRARYPNQFDKDIDEMFHDRLLSYENEYEGVAKVQDFPRGRYFTAAEISGLGAVRLITEGGRVEFDTPEEGHRKQVEAKKYGLGFALTEEMEDDDYAGKIKNVSETLADSAQDIVNTEYFNLFNDATTLTSWDGVAILSNSHTTLKSGDTIDNLSAAALSETGLQGAFEHADAMVDEAGRPARINFSKLLVHPQDRWVAHQLANQMGGITVPGSDTAEASGNMMTVNPANGATPNSWNYKVCRYLDTAGNWFFVDEQQHQAMLLWKKPITLEAGDDFHTGTRLYKVTLRFIPAVFDYKGIYGYIA